MKKVLIILFALVVLAALGLYLYLKDSERRLSQLALASTTDHILGWEQRVTLNTQLGAITGLSNGGANAFLGIRYGEAPTGERRFRTALPSGPWRGTLDATSFGKSCWQGGDDVSQLSEDSLFLNIYTPSTMGANRPVLFWIHGGSFVSGSGRYDGSVMARQGDVVVVAVNYRLGMLGFLDLSAYGDEFAGSGSNGIADQILALKWVRDNISDYGGDPNNVTLFGESAGGSSVIAIMSAPSADGLYHKAVSHSGFPVEGSPGDQRKTLANQLDVDTADLADELRRMTPEEIMELQGAVSFGAAGAVDGTVVTRHPYEAILMSGESGVPLIAGSNRDEGKLFSFLIPSLFYGSVTEMMAPETLLDSGEDYLDAMKAAYPDDTRKQRHDRVWNEHYQRAALGWTSRASAAGPGGWLYSFDLPSQVEELGAAHGLEIAFTMNHFAGGAPDGAFLYDRHDPVVRQLALDWSNTIIEFARTGDPNGAGLPQWPRYTAETREIMILDATSRVVSNLYAADRPRWGATETSSTELRGSTE